MFGEPFTELQNNGVGRMNLKTEKEIERRIKKIVLFQRLIE